MKQPSQQADRTPQQIINRTLWLDVKIFALTTGVIFGTILLIATLWLVIKGGDTVGPHLQLLGNFFIGYRVTPVGSVIGFLYGFGCGCVIGGAISWIYNKIARRSPDVHSG